MSFSTIIEHLVRSRLARLALAGTLITLGVWAFLPHVAYRIAPMAYVNAELVRVTAPMAGRLARDLPRKGEIIDHSITVRLTETVSPDRRHLANLEQQTAVAKDRAALAERQLVEIAAVDRELEARATAYQIGMMQRLGQEIAEVEAERVGCLAEVHQRRVIGTQMEQMVKLGIASQIRSAEAFATQEAAAMRCTMAEARIQRFRLEKNSAEQGVFLRDGAGDVPYSQQQRDRLLLRRQELETEMLQQSSRALQLAAEVSEERNRLGRIGHSELLLPADHVVWAVSASPGSTVTEGQTILDLANCAHRFVVVDLPERSFEQIKANDPTAVRLIGSEEWRQGRVRQVLGSAARSDDRLLAAQVPHPTSTSVTVEVELLQEDKSESERNSFCNIGRKAEVRFQRTGFGLIDRLFKVSIASLVGGESQLAAVNKAARH